MRRIVLLILSLSLLICLSACGSDTSTNYESNYNYNTSSQHTHYYNNATCTSPATCSCGATNGSALGHSYSGEYCTRCAAKNPNYIKPSQPSHTHYYSSSVTREATCGNEGVRTYKCSCGHSYTESISKKSYHNWEYATCTKPKTCKDCGKTEGTAQGHNYYSDGECSRCGADDPAKTQALAKCSLSLPTLPKTIHYYNYSGNIESSVSVTGITYNFEYYGDGNVILTAKFSGKKTYDKKGSGQSSSCRIGWKLYDPQGNVFRTGTFSSPSVAMGESFANQEEDLIYNFEATKPGKFRLEILNVN
jgi:hypothetical protein